MLIWSLAVNYKSKRVLNIEPEKPACRPLSNAVQQGFSNRFLSFQTAFLEPLATRRVEQQHSGKVQVQRRSHGHPLPIGHPHNQSTTLGL